jgi:hypothetical protein
MLPSNCTRSLSGRAREKRPADAQGALAIYEKFRGRPVAADAERVLARAQAVTEFSRFMAGMMTQTSLGAIQGARGAKRLEHRACGAGGLREHEIRRRVYDPLTTP